MTWRSFIDSNLGVVVVYSALALAFTWPLVPVMTTHVPHGANDIWQNLWNFWWWREAIVELGANPYWTDLLFFPHGTSLVLHTHSTFNQIAAFPINLLFGPIAALNFATLLGFALSGVAAHQLAYEVTSNRTSAYLAGLIFAFFPHHFEQSLEHLNLSSLQFMPWVALYGLRVVRDGSQRNALMFGVVFALNALSCWHYALFTVFILPWLWIAELWGSTEAGARIRASVRPLLVSGAVVAVIMGPFAASMATQVAGVDTLAKPPVERGIDLAFLLVPSDQHPLFGELTRGYYQARRAYPALGSQAFAGYVALALAGIALLRVRGNRNAIGWALVLGSSLLLALGAHPTLGGEPMGVTLPHAVFEHVPLFKTLRVANRFIVISMLAIAVLAAMGFERALRDRRHAGMLIAGLIALEFLWTPYPMQRVDFSPLLDELGERASGAVLDIPFSDRSTSALNLAYQTRHGRPIAGGYISVGPDGEAALANEPTLLALSGMTPTLPARIDVSQLRALGFSHVVLHKDRTRESLARSLADLPANATFYERRQFENMPGIPEPILERISVLIEREVGRPMREDARVRIYSLAP